MDDLTDIVVVGTDTNVGKSVVALLLMQLFYAKGYAPFYLKPFQTGCADPYDADSDAAFIYRHTRALKEQDPACSVIHCYANAKAPYYAAKDMGRSVDLKLVLNRIRHERSRHAPLVVETAGGLLVPVTDALLVVDVIAHWNCSPLLVARAGLGTINHTLLSIEALHQRGVDPLGVVLVDTVQTPADPGLVAENMEAIEQYSGVTVGGVIPVIADFSADLSHTFKPLEKMLF